MDSRVAAVPNPPVYEDFEASSEWVQEKDCDTILLNLPGFRKEHLKVQLTSPRTLKVSGSRQIEGNKWRRFLKEFPLAPTHDTQKISAKFESGILYIRLPKVTTPAEKKDDQKQNAELPASDPTAPPHQKPADQTPSQKSSVKEQASRKPAPKDDSSKHTNAQAVKEEPKAAREKTVEPTAPEKKGEKSPEERASGLDASKEKSNAGDNRDDDSAKKSPEDKTNGLDDSKKKRSAGDKQEDDSAKAAEKREKEGTETTEGSNKSRVQNYKETAADVASELRKHWRIFNLALVIIFSFTIGLYLTNFIRSLKTKEN